MVKWKESCVQSGICWYQAIYPGQLVSPFPLKSTGTSLHPQSMNSNGSSSKLYFIFQMTKIQPCSSLAPNICSYDSMIFLTCYMEFVHSISFMSLSNLNPGWKLLNPDPLSIVLSLANVSSSQISCACCAPTVILSHDGLYPKQMAVYACLIQITLQNLRFSLNFI